MGVGESSEEDLCSIIERKGRRRRERMGRMMRFSEISQLRRYVLGGEFTFFIFSRKSRRG